MPALASTSQARDRTQYIVKTLQDHEVFAEQDRQAIAALEAESREPLYLPSIAEVEAQ